MLSVERLSWSAAKCWIALPAGLVTGAREELNKGGSQSGTGGGTRGGALRWWTAAGGLRAVWAGAVSGGRSSGGGCDDDACGGAQHGLGERWALATWLRAWLGLICWWVSECDKSNLVMALWMTMPQCLVAVVPLPVDAATGAVGLQSCWAGLKTWGTQVFLPNLRVGHGPPGPACSSAPDYYSRIIIRLFWSFFPHVELMVKMFHCSWHISISICNWRGPWS
jgi:hypothetical protein